MFLETLTELLLEFLLVLVGYFNWASHFWKCTNLPSLQPWIPYGYLTSPIRCKENVGIIFQKFYKEMKQRHWKHASLHFMLSPVYMVVDLDYARNIMTKDFQHFSDRGTYYNEEDDPMSAHLVFLNGLKWKNLRTALTPTFTSGKMKTMSQTMVECSVNLVKKVQSECEKTSAIDAREVLGCFTTDIICSCAFGLNLGEGKNSLFMEYGRQSFAASGLAGIKYSFANTFPNFAKRVHMKIIPKEISSFFIRMVTDIVNHREKNNCTRRDFMGSLMDLKNNELARTEGYGHDGKTLTIDEMAAQCFAFFLGGFETSSTTMTFALYELSKNEEMQQRLRKEINCVLATHGDQITYNAVQEMKFLKQIIEETLRKYPTISFLTRRCVVDYKIPEENVTIEKGTIVIISTLGIHHDEEYYPDPEKFDPERFNEENKKSRHNYAYMPFGGGPRICIGQRFGLLQIKIGLTSLLRKFKFTVNEKTREPLTMHPQSFGLAAEGEIWLNAEEIEDS